MPAEMCLVFGLPHLEHPNFEVEGSGSRKAAALLLHVVLCSFANMPGLHCD